MKKTALVIAGLLCVIALAAGSITQTSAATPQQESSMEASKLGVVWTSGDRDVALKMVFMYTLNAKSQNWFEAVRLVVWGPSAKLLSVDEELQQEVAKMKDAGVELVACKACADSYGVSEKLEQLGVEVKYMGVPLSDMLKQDWKVVTF
jgi:hypothetical protein